MTATPSRIGFEVPNLDDFVRRLDDIRENSRQQAARARTVCDSKAAMQGALGSSRHLFTVDDAVRPFHEKGITEMCQLSASFHQDYGFSLDVLLEIIEPLLDKFNEEFTDILRTRDRTGAFGKNGLGPAAESLSDKYNNRITNALRDLRTGYVAGSNVRKPASGLRERAFKLLQSAYDMVISDVGQEVNLYDVGRDIGMAPEHVQGAESYLVKFGLMEKRAADTAIEGAGRAFTVTARGIAEVEDAHSHPERPTAHFPANVVTIVVGHMSRDTYTVGQAGAVGPQAHAEHMSFQQIWQQNPIDLEQAAAELARLRTSMRATSEATAEYDIAVGAIAAAEKAAKDGDGPGMLQHLKPVGEWSLAIAEKVGVPVAVAAIKQACGLP